MSLKGKIVRALALRWLRGEVKREGSMVAKALKLVQGWKLVLAFVALVGVKWWDAAHNGHSAEFLGGILSVLGITPPEWTWTAAGTVAANLLGIVAIVGKVLRAQKQARAGATLTELLSPEGYAKEAAALKAASHVTAPALKG